MISVRLAYPMILVFLLLGPLPPAAPPVYAQSGRAAIYFDGSGSMKGYFTSGSILEINSKVYEAFSSMHLTPTSQVFVTQQNTTTLQPIDMFTAKPAWGAQTRLDEAFSRSRENDVIALVTDNVQDTGPSGTSSTRSFYRLLESREVEAVLLCPLKTPFNGPVYFYKQQFPDRMQLLLSLRKENKGCTFTEPQNPSQLYHVLNMDGRRALALYIVVRPSFPLEKIPTLLARIEKTFGIAPLLFVKPVDQGKFTLEGVTARGEVKESFEAMSRSCEEYERGGFPLRAPNLRLSPPASTLFRPVSASDEGRFILRPFRHTPYRVDQEMQYEFYAKLLNGSDTIRLGKDGGGCGRNVSIELRDLHYTVPPQFGECLFRPQKGASGAIIPGFIPNVVANLDGGTPGNTPPFIAHIGIRVPSFGVKTTFRSILRLALTSEIPLLLEGSIRVSVPPGYFSLTRKFQDAHFTESIYDQGRIYTPEDIVSYTNTHPTEIVFSFVSKDLRLLPPAWIRHALYGFLGLVLAILLFILVSFSGRYYFKFNDTGETLLVSLPLPFTNRFYSREDAEMLRFSRGLLGYRVAPCDGYSLKDPSGETTQALGLGSAWNFLVKRSGEQDGVIVARVKGSEHAANPLKARLSGKRKAEKKNREKPGEGGPRQDSKKKKTRGAAGTEYERLFGSDE